MKLHHQFVPLSRTSSRWLSALAMVFLGLSVLSSGAATFTVTNTNDAGPGSLRQAIADAQAGSGAQTVTFDPALFSAAQTITLSSGELAISASGPLTITGPGANVLTVQRDMAAANFRIFNIGAGAKVTLSGLTITNGKVEFEGGHPRGGGIVNSGDLTITDCKISGNSAYYGGGGIACLQGAIVRITASTISGNSAPSPNSGGGILVHPGAQLFLNDSTVSGNQADAQGGGISNIGTSVITNSTISGNFITTNLVGTQGAGIISNGALTIRNSTVSGNAARSVGGGILRFSGGTFTMSNTVVAGNTAPTGPDIYGPTSSQGYNLIGNTSGGSGWAATDLLNVDPLLGPLADNGGPTKTHAPLAGSPLIDAGDPAFDPYSFTPAIGTDQRGFVRVKGGRIDIGAVEAGSAPNAAPVAVPGVNAVAHPGVAVQLNGADSFDDNDTGSLQYAWSFVSVPSGSAAILGNADSATPSFTPDALGDYVVQLVVTDRGIPALESAPAFVVLSSNNQAPTGVATATPQLPFVGQSVQLSSVGTNDPDGDAISYAWTVTERPAGSSAAVVSPNAASATLVPDAAGSYTVTLTPSDFLGAGEPVTVSFTASSTQSYIEQKLRDAAALAESLPANQVTSKGNQKDFVKKLEKALKHAQHGRYSKAIKELDKVIVRTDGFPLRGALDLSGSSRDWILTQSAQTQLYTWMNQARNVLNGMLPDNDDGQGDDGDDD